MKTSLTNQFTHANTVLIVLTSFLFGYDLYKIIVHPESSDLAQSFLFLAITIAMIGKYSRKTKEE